MDIIQIVRYGDPILRAKAAEVGEFSDDLRTLIERMYVTLADAHGYGLAGPQVAVSKRLFVYDIGEGQHALINPRITRASGEEWGVEGCLSIPGLQGEVPRATRITITGVDENGKHVKMKAEGLLARVFQHETDHLDGTMFIDKADPETLETVSPSDEDEEE